MITAWILVWRNWFGVFLRIFVSKDDFHFLPLIWKSVIEKSVFKWSLKGDCSELFFSSAFIESNYLVLPKWASYDLEDWPFHIHKLTISFFLLSSMSPPFYLYITIRYSITFLLTLRSFFINIFIAILFKDYWRALWPFSLFFPLGTFLIHADELTIIAICKTMRTM